MTDEAVTLYHYTCDHGHRGISQDHLVRPGIDLPRVTGGPLWAMQVAWFTDLDAPLREALGLTQHLAKCDRTAWRYRVTDASHVQPYIDARHALPRHVRALLESEPGAMPMHWWCSTLPVPVVLAQRGAA